MPLFHISRALRAHLDSAKTTEATPARETSLTARTREKRSMYHMLPPQGHAQIVARQIVENGYG